MNYAFQNSSKFALQTFNNVNSDLPQTLFQLSDGTWVMPGIPISDWGLWKEWIGSARVESLKKANIVLFVEEQSGNPQNFDAVHQRLMDNLSRLFYLVHLRSGIEYESGDLLCGSSEGGKPRIRQMSQQASFFQSKGYRRHPLNREWLEDAVALRAGVITMEAKSTEFRRLTHGLNTLFSGLKAQGQDRLHQFVRSLEGLILPAIGNTKKQFTHRCQTFAPSGDDTQFLLQEAYDMRSNTEHLHEWDKAVQLYPEAQREDICWQRTRQIEKLACDAYSRVLRDTALREYFRTDGTIDAFWKLSEEERRTRWGEPLDITLEPLH